MAYSHPPPVNLIAYLTFLKRDWQAANGYHTLMFNILDGHLMQTHTPAKQQY